MTSSPAPWDGTCVDLLGAGLAHVGVDLRGLDVGVPQDLLNGADVGPVLHQVRGHRVAKQMAVGTGLGEAGQMEVTACKIRMNPTGRFRLKATDFDLVMFV